MTLLPPLQPDTAPQTSTPTTKRMTIQYQIFSGFAPAAFALGCSDR
jgi:hypothetical protein